ncbi:MAG: SLATT domain-containing protein [Actinomycetota bacterium]
MARVPSKPKASPARAAWDDEVEQLYAAWHRRVAAAELGHRLMSDRLRRRYLALGIPVVVLTTLVGTSVFASLQDSDVPTGVRFAIGTVSILAAVLSSLQTFLRYATRSEGHRIAALRYESLRRDMAAVLATRPEARRAAAQELSSVRTRMDRYAKESPTIGQRQWQKLLAPFNLSDVPPDPGSGSAVRIPEAGPGATA